MTLGVTAPRVMELLEREPTSTMREAELFRGYSSAVVSRPCLCGVQIEAIDTHEAIAESVSDHNASGRHAQWAIRAGWR